jgi:CRP-like cAMP-binding protein/glyoxylase-like metal-dependent hydrolase (beta-lactamase superfamily II)
MLVRLPRGGVIVDTSAGAIQLGAPPETIKDTLAAGRPVPSIFVLPSTWFSRSRGLTVAELEFPVYYNFFVLGRRVTAVCDVRGRDRLRAILREALFGPAAAEPLDYDATTPAALRADFAAEGGWFRRKNGDPERSLALDDVLAFALYDDTGVAEVAPGVRVERFGSQLVVRDQGVLVAELDDDELAPVPVRAHPHPRPFAPPAFGLTVLGSSHGFDPAGKTTGFVLWVNHRGILVDPPTDATELLRAAGVAPGTVDSVVLTHCHADHDAGVFQKILEAGRVSLYTTPTILGSFLRKYVALSDEPEERLRRLFVFRPVTIGAPLRIQGAEFRFFYTLHSIPTIGFECFFGGRSFAYSADTLYDPARIEAMHLEGVLGVERRDALLAFPWHHTLVVHEAGVPPIHTPVARLAELPDEVKHRLRVIHMAEADLPKGAGLRLARTGFDETVVLPVAEHPYADVLQALDALAQVDLLRDFTVERCREFLTIARRQTMRAGTLVIGQGEAGDRFYIIVSGELVVLRDGVVVKQYKDGDFFGETALVTGAPRSADVRARTDAVVLAVDKHDFLALLRGTDLADALLRLAVNRDLPSWDLIGENPVLRVLNSRQRTQLQASLEHCRLAAGDRLWDRGVAPDTAWLLDDAEVELLEDGHVPVRLGRGAFVGDLEAMLRQRRLGSRAACVRPGGAFRIAAGHLGELCEQSPALMLALSGACFVA